MAAPLFETAVHVVITPVRASNRVQHLPANDGRQEFGEMSTSVYWFFR
jgi:hypothetical protein